MSRKIIIFNYRMSMNRTILLIACLLATAPAWSGEEVIKLNDGLNAFRNHYLSGATHRAFAQSPDGATGWATGRTSTEHAVDDALETCHKQLQPGERACSVIHIDGDWVSG